ncbi:MAG: four helix bundle protein [Candidatus Daviesbacteria bacterium]|nr:four helix bundle protein [Candidatus Daviesbacteria bacterium]
MDQPTKIQYFTDLFAWKKGHELVLKIYIITKTFPREEIYALVDQMRRCGISITSNIAEGFSRKSYKEKIQFYSMALGSTTELQNQILVAKDVGYITQEQFLALSDLMLEIHKLLNGLIKSSRKYLI